jgi:hypothetical protein
LNTALSVLQLRSATLPGVSPTRLVMAHEQEMVPLQTLQAHGEALDER